MYAAIDVHSCMHGYMHNAWLSIAWSVLLLKEKSQKLSLITLFLK